MRIGVLTGGGDCPGLNAVIRAVVRKGVTVYGHEFVGFRDGWRGPIEGITTPLDVAGGARHPAARRHDPRLVAHQPVQDRRRRREDRGRTSRELGVDALIAIGGEDTLGVATKLHEHGVHVVGVPKTIDNDLNATDYTFGFDTAVNVAMEAIDRLHTTAESHHRALIVEVMGRHAGWIALHAGMAGGANVILIPEVPFDIEKVCDYVESRFESHYSPIIVVSEGAHPPRARWRCRRRARLVRARAARRHRPAAGEGDREAHRQGGAHHRARPHPARRYADGAATAGSPPGSGCTPSTPSTTATGATMVALRGTDIERVPLGDATTELKLADPHLYAEAEVFFG